MPSPFLLEGVIECHFESWEPRMPELVAELRKSLYLDDFIIGKPTVKEAQQLKQGAIEVFDDAKFTLLNAADLEDNVTKVEDEESFAKQQLGRPGGRRKPPWASLGRKGRQDQRSYAARKLNHV